jgi:uncharacterized protein YdcH (DUF465 family)
MNEQSGSSQTPQEIDQEIHDLSVKHHELDDRLHALASKTYLSDAEQFEEVSLKKQKLHFKDRMETLVRQQQRRRPTLAGGASAQASSRG